MKHIAHTPDWAAWNSLAWEGWTLWVEAGTVIWLRTLRLAAGGALADREAGRMVSEKLAANWELGLALLAGGPAAPEQAARRSVRHYRSRVRANRRRLGG